MNTTLPMTRTRRLFVGAILAFVSAAALPAQQPAAPAPAPAAPTIEQTAVITAMNAALAAEAQAVTTALANLAAASLATPRDNARITAANDAVAAARQAWAMKASQLFAAQQATVIPLGPAATTQLVNTVPGSGGRGGAARGAAAPTLMFAELPKAGTEKLWNGVDFTGWELLVASSPRGGGPQTVRPEQNFTIVQDEGQPAISLNGLTTGTMATVREIGPNVHIHAAFKYVPGPATHNSGVQYHTNGEPTTASGGAWRQSIEFQMMTGATGRGIAVSGVQQVAVTTTKGAGVDFYDALRPIGQWNTLDIYLVGDQAVHVVNGIPVIELQNIRITTNGVTSPLTRGRLALQAEVGQVLYRDVTIEPIDKLPVVIVK